MDLIVTGSLLAISVILTGFFGWMGARPPNIHKGPRLVPWRLLMLTMAAVVLVLLTHAASFLGFGRH
jgi:hypothetical protein